MFNLPIRSERNFASQPTALSVARPRGEGATGEDRICNDNVEKAQTIKYARVGTRIMRPEHLVAIMLDTGLPKDHLRISIFLEQGAINMRSLNAVLKRHGLLKKWEDNEYRFKP